MGSKSVAVSVVAASMMVMMMRMMSTALTLIVGDAEQLLRSDLDGRRCPVLHLRSLRHDDAVELTC